MRAGASVRPRPLDRGYFGQNIEQAGEELIERRLTRARAMALVKVGVKILTQPELAFPPHRGGEVASP